MLNPRFLHLNNAVRFGPTALAIDALVGRAVFGGLIMLIGFSAFSRGVVEPWWEPILIVAIFTLSAGWIVTILFSKQWRVHMMLAPVAGLILLACLQLLPIWRLGWRSVSVDPIETRSFIIKSLAVGLTLAMLLYYTSSQKRLLALAHLVVFVGVASAGLGLLLWLAPAIEFKSLWHDNLLAESFGQFVNRNHFALLMEMSLGPALGLALCASGRAAFWSYVATVLIICVALVLANSRGGIISMLVQVAFFSWTWFGSLQRASLTWSPYGHHRFWRMSEALARRVVLTIFFLGIASVTVLWLGGEPVRRRLEQMPREFMQRTKENSSPRRLEIWAATGNLIADHPVLGSGLGAYHTAISDYFPTSHYWPPERAHNEYLELLAGGGIIGAVLGGWFVFIVISESRRRLYDSNPLRRSICLGALVGLVGVVIHSLVDFGLHVTVNAVVCCVLVTMAATKIRSGSPQYRRTAA